MILIVFTVGFWLIWRHFRDLVAAKWFALSYGFGAAALVVEFLRPALPLFLAPPLANLSFLVAACCFSAGVFRFYGAEIPWKWMIGVAGTVYPALLAFQFVHDDLLIRILILNAGVAILFGLPAVLLRDRLGSGLDRLLGILLWANVGQYFLRSLLVARMDGGALTSQSYLNSVAGALFHFTVVAIALSIATLLFVLFGMRIVTRLKARGEIDFLTGCYNRAGFAARVDALETALGLGLTSHAIVVCDLDRFKSVNDRFGHEAGDLILRRFAIILDDHARNDDVVIRWGGEEFVVLLRGADKGAARHFAEAVRQAFASVRHDSTRGEPVTASFGIAAWYRGTSFAEVYGRADKALYEAKRMGRNRVCPVSSADPYPEPVAIAAVHGGLPALH